MFGLQQFQWFKKFPMIFEEMQIFNDSKSFQRFIESGQMNSRPKTRPIYPKWWWFSKGNLLFQGNLGWWNIIIWPDRIQQFDYQFVETLRKVDG